MERKIETPIFTVSMTNSQIKKFRKLMVIIIATIFVISIFIVITNNTKIVIIYSGLDFKEAEEIISILKINKIYSEYNSELGTIAVKEKDATNVVMAIAMEGYPNIDLYEK